MSTVKTFNLQHPSSSVVNMTLATDGSVSGNLPTGGRNRIINGGFDVWQRGTSFSVGAGTYVADRWMSYISTGSCTTSQQTFTPGTAPVSGYESEFYLRADKTTATSAIFVPAWQRIENVRTLAGQTVTVSFWAKASTSASGVVDVYRIFGSGGSSTEGISTGITFNLSTTWQRFSASFAMPSVSGKTIGANSYVEFQPLRFNGLATPLTVDLWGVQLEAGTAATPFEVKPYAQELRDCQRYYCRLGTDSSSPYGNIGVGAPYSGTNGLFHIQLPVEMRIPPTSLSWNALQIMNFGTSQYAVTDLSISGNRAGKNAVLVNPTSSGLTIGQFCFLAANNSGNGYIAFNAEL